MPDHAAAAGPTPAPGRRPPAPSRRRLDRGWRLCQGMPGAGTPPEADAGWLDIDEPLPVAAALARLGHWSIDGPARTFDAETWWYRLGFDLPAEEADAPWVLGFDGLATLAEVQVNGQPVLSSRNMFRRHHLPLSGLRARGNELLLRFDPLEAALAQRRPRPRWRVPMLVHQQLRHVRTTLLGRTPGWSPPAAVVGPWQPVWLERADRPALSGCRIEATVSGAGPDATGRLALSVAWRGALTAGARLRLLGGEQPIEAALAPTADGQAWAATVEITPLRRWWPHTHGEPSLYMLEVERQDAGGSHEVWPLGRVGFRALAIDRHDGGFGVVVNGVPVFCRGACWVPLDTLRLHATPADYRAVLQRVREAGFNMLRVPGTMVYEHPAFFDACDAAGVMVWQDLMFASMDYPEADPAFAAEVEAELAEHLPAWQGRPSVVVVCGNSEVEQQATMWGAEAALWSPPLFHATVPARVQAQLGELPYWPSSAHGGDFPFQPGVGTTSYYGVGAYRRPVDDAHAGGLRFATECLAFANVPGDATLARVPGLGAPLQMHQPGWKSRVPRDLGAGWDFDDVRDHYAEQLLGERVDRLRASDPARHLALARAVSGEVMAGAFVHWRRHGAVCRGALVWTLRDLWAGAGWGLLDDRAEPKPAFQALARVLQPLHLAIVDEGLDGLAVHLDNEGAETLDGTLELVLYQDDVVEVARGRAALRLPARSRARHGAMALLGRFVDAGWAYRFGPPGVSLAVATLVLADGRRLPPACWFAPGALARPSAHIGLAARCEPGPDPACRTLHLRSERAAWGVHFDADGWRASDEFFHLPPGHEVLVRFEPTDPARRVAGRLPPWRVMAGALNTRQWLALPDLPAA